MPVYEIDKFKYIADFTFQIYPFQGRAQATLSLEAYFTVKHIIHDLRQPEGFRSVSK